MLFRSHLAQCLNHQHHPVVKIGSGYQHRLIATEPLFVSTAAAKQSWRERHDRYIHFRHFFTLDGYGSYGPDGNWGGYWGKQGPELLERRRASFDAEHRMVFGATTFRQFVEMLASSTEKSDLRDPWVTRMTNMPATVVSSTLKSPLDWPDATVVSGDAFDIVARLKKESAVPLRSHGSLSLNRALMAAGLVDLVRVTVFPVISGKTGTQPIFKGASDFDLELVESRTLDGNIQELIYRPTLHV